MTEAVLKIGVDSTDLAKAKKSLDDLASASAAAEKKTDDLGDSTTELGEKTKKTSKDVGGSTKGIGDSYKAMGSSVVSSIGKVVASIGLMQDVRMFESTVIENEKLRGALVTMTCSTKNATAAF